MCGSGTFLIEAAMIAANIAPGILRESYGFSEWKQYESNIWDGLISDARSKKKVGLAELDIEIKGLDINPRIIEVAAKNIEKAGLDEHIKVSQRSMESIVAPTVQKGLFVTNPPYGERLGDKANLNKLYKSINLNEAIGFSNPPRLKKLSPGR
jgi:23S rRNA (guanine2445-N2)-methyltransferase / 23S rRNA (guanine2069-N7)-methyltransferase